MRRRALFPALACLGLLMVVQPAPGQVSRRDTGSNPSHILLPGGVGDRNAAEDLLAQRLLRSRDLSVVQDVLQKIGVKPEDFIDKDFLKNPKVREMAEKFKNHGNMPINPDDPALREMVRQAKENLQKQKKLGKEEEESLQRIFGDLKKQEMKNPDDPGRPPIPPGGIPPGSTPPGGMPPGGIPPGGHAPMPGGSPPPGSEPTSPTGSPPSTPPTQPERPERPNLFGGLFDPLRGEGGISGELRNALRDLLSSHPGLGDYTRELTRSLGSRLPRLGDLPLSKFARGLGSAMPDFQFRPREQAGRLNVGMPNFSDGPNRSSLGTAVLVIALLAGVGVLLWALIVRPRWVGAGQDSWRLGPWPVRPSAVRTRGDVVKAFEYLALLLLGRKVSTSHHLDLAGQLGTSQDDPTGRRQNAAQELAVLYEHARYAPPEEQLSDDELAAARRDLGFLAGGAAA